MGLLTGQNATKYSQYTADQFTGNGSQTIFTLSRVPVTTSSLMVSIDGVKQHSTTYTLNAGTIVFTEAPPNGSAIECIAISSPGVSFVPTDNTVGTMSLIDGSVTSSKIANGAVNASELDVANYDGTGALNIPAGTTSQRPSVPGNGQTRFNNTTGFTEIYQNGLWNSLAFSYQIEYLVVAGGGAGGASSVNSSCGGGGAGGMIVGAFTTLPQVSFNITIGAGGAAQTNNQGLSGSNSTLIGGSLSLTAIGGGGGGGGTSSTSSSPGLAGGSGGGSLQPSAPGSGTTGQGNSGGYGSNSSPSWGGGGGGGAGAAGTGGTATLGGAGGAGLSWVDGIFYAGGGGGATYNGYAGGAGGIGGGGAGGSTSSGTAGTANRGGGGGAGSYPGNSYASAAGGSGVVIIRYAGTQKATGGVVTYSNGYTYHKFTSAGQFVS